MLDVDVDIGSDRVRLKASVGVAWTIEVVDADSLIAQADRAMYTSKRSESCSTTLFAS